MFLDTFMDDASEGIMQNPIPDLEDLQLECAVSLEAAYSDLMLEGCQLKYQEIAEGASVSAINEGVIEAIKNFFKKLFNAIKKFFGFGSSSSGDGASRQNIDKLKKQLEDKQVIEGMDYLADHPELWNGEEFKIPDGKTLIMLEESEINNGLKNAIDVAQFDIEEGSKHIGEEKTSFTLDSDKIALSALRTFIMVACKRYNGIVDAEINSLGDFKNALEGYTKMVPPPIIKYDMNENYREDVDTMDEYCQEIQNNKKVVIKQMENFQKRVMTEIPPEYAAIGCKVAKTLTNAVMILYSYECRMVKRSCEVLHRIIELAIKVSTKTK